MKAKSVDMNYKIDQLPLGAYLLGRVWCPDVAGPSVCVVQENEVYDITSSQAPTMSDVLEQDNPVSFIEERMTYASCLGDLEEIAKNSLESSGDLSKLHFLAPCDLQAIKACGVTFAQSMVERVIEEKAAGDAAKAKAIRDQLTQSIGESLKNIKAGSEQTEKLKQVLQAEGLWSQYLEVGIGPDAEIFTKGQPMSAVGLGANIGIHPISNWNNPEPEIVLAVSSKGKIVGATLGNDVNLRDVEGRSALLLGKAKDNNASCAIGPLIRLFDEGYTLNDVRHAHLDLVVQGQDGFMLKGTSSMNEISRDPEDLVKQTIGRHHQYPDGLMLFMGTLFAPTQDRDKAGEGFTHKIGDVVSISSKELGTLINMVQWSTECPEWIFGTRALMKNLAKRNLI